MQWGGHIREFAAAAPPVLHGGMTAGAPGSWLTFSGRRPSPRWPPECDSGRDASWRAVNARSRFVAAKTRSSRPCRPVCRSAPGRLRPQRARLRPRGFAAGGVTAPPPLRDPACGAAACRPAPAARAFRNPCNTRRHRPARPRRPGPFPGGGPTPFSTDSAGRGPFPHHGTGRIRCMRPRPAPALPALPDGAVGPPLFQPGPHGFARSAQCKTLLRRPLKLGAG